MSMPLESGVTCIKDIRPGQRHLTSEFIVLDIYGSTKTKEGKDVATIKVADATGSINVVLYGDYVTALSPSDVLRMTSGYAVINKGSMCLYMAKHGNLSKIGEFCFLFTESPNMSEAGAEFLSEYLQAQPQNGRGSSPPNFEMPPEPTGGGGGGYGSGGGGPGGQPQGRLPGGHYQAQPPLSLSSNAPTQSPWMPPQPQQPPFPPSDASGRLLPPFDLSSGRTGIESPPHSASSPPPSEQSSVGPRTIPAQMQQIPPAAAFPPVSAPSAVPLDPRTSRAGHGSARYHPYQQQPQSQQQQQQQQQRQPLQPMGPLGSSFNKSQQPQQQGPPRSFGQQNNGSTRSGPPVIPSNPVAFRPSNQHPASVRR